MPKLGRPEERLEAAESRDEGVGWYQDSDGGLFHFNGTVWDVVPEDLRKRLEYLG